MAEWKPLITSLMILILVGGILPTVIAEFVEFNSVEHTGYTDPIIRLIEEGFTYGFDIPVITNLPFIGSFADNLTHVDINPFTWFGDVFQEALINYLIAFSYIPLQFAVPLLMIAFIGMIWSMLNLLRGS